MEAIGLLILILLGVCAWFFVSLFASLIRQREPSLLRNVLLVAMTLFAVAVGLVCYAVR